MNVGVSNIAWPAEEEEAVADALAAAGVTQVEIAPTKVFDDPLDVSDEAIARYREFWESRGIRIVAFQSLLFGRGDLHLFGDAASREGFVGHIARFLELGGRMGAGALVFGSPKNRIVPEGMGATEAFDLAAAAFGRLGRIAADNGTCLCIEPNPSQYGGNWVTDADAGAAIVSAVDSPGFRLHLDAAGMTLAGDDVGRAIRDHAVLLRHFHISAPNLEQLEDTVVDHPAAARALVDVGYAGTASIEMKSGAPGTAVARVDAALALARTHYSSS